MTPADVIDRVEGLGIRIWTEGRSVKFSPRSAMPPELTEIIKAQKAAVIETLVARSSKPVREPAIPVIQRKPVTIRCRRCGSDEYIDVPIHHGQSIRRDCAKCGRLIDFPVWYGKSDGVKV